MTNLSEQEIIKAIREGNAEIFRLVFDSYYENLCHYAFTMLKSTEEAEDIVQFLFLKLWDKREQLNIKLTVRSYLFKSVYHRCINHLEHKSIIRDHQKYNQRIANAEAQLPEIFPNELENNIREAINKLPPRCRSIFIMSRYEELTYAEIAKRLNISVNTIQNQICKALRILREELKDMLV